MTSTNLPRPYDLSIYVNPFAKDLERTLEFLARRGIQWIGTHGIRWRDCEDRDPDEFHKSCEKIAALLNSANFQISSCHAVGPHFDAEQCGQGQVIAMGMLDLEGFASWRPRNIVYHPYVPASDPHHPEAEVARLIYRNGRPTIDKQVVDCFQSWADRAANLGICLAIENMPFPWSCGRRLSEMQSLVAQIGRPNVGLCWDSGHTATHGFNGDEELIKAKGKLFETHLHDNRGVRARVDQHLPIGLGVIDWVPIVRSLWEIGYGGPATFEVGYIRSSHKSHQEDFERGVDASIANWKMFEEIALEELLQDLRSGINMEKSTEKQGIIS